MASLSFTVNEDLTLTLLSQPGINITGAGLYFYVQVKSGDSLSVEFNAAGVTTYFNTTNPFTFAPSQPSWIQIGGTKTESQVSLTISSVTSQGTAPFFVNLADGRAVDPTIVNDPPG